MAEGGATGGRAGATARKRKEKADVEQKLASCVQDSASGSREDRQNLVRKSL